MSINPLLEEFIGTNKGDLQRRLTLAFNAKLDASDDDAVICLKAELDAIMKERIDAASENQAVVLSGLRQH